MEIFPFVKLNEMSLKFKMMTKYYNKSQMLLNIYAQPVPRSVFFTLNSANSFIGIPANEIDCFEGPS